MVTSVRLAPEITNRLDTLAARTGQTKARLLREIIENGIEDAEDYYLASEVLERVRNGTEQVYALDEVKRHLGLAD